MLAVDCAYTPRGQADTGTLPPIITRRIGSELRYRAEWIFYYSTTRTTPTALDVIVVRSHAQAHAERFTRWAEAHGVRRHTSQSYPPRLAAWAATTRLT